MFYAYNSKKLLNAVVWFIVWVLFTTLCVYNLYTTVMQIQDNYSSVDIAKARFFVFFVKQHFS